VNVLFILLLASGISSIALNTKQIDRTKNDLDFLLYNFQRGNNMYEPEGHIIHQDIQNVFNRGIVEKAGAPGGWEESFSLWFRRTIMRFGIGMMGNGQGIKVNVPDGGYNTLWLRVLNDRWFHIRIRGDNDFSEPERYTAGYRQLNEYSPDGAAADTEHTRHMWMHVPIRQQGPLYVMSEVNSDSYISGIAFSRNPWNHVRNSAVAYHWAVNGGDNARWHTHNWYNDNLASFDSGAIRSFRVPVIYSGRDKLVYIVEHNNNWLGTMHGDFWVGNQKVERFRTTYTNPFATHFNSKMYDRYMAAKVPANLIAADQKFLDCKIDMSFSDHHIHFREIGSHDFN
jgi:hypothetical protein